MPDLIEILESFNRKERFFLVAQALGKPEFELSPVFRWKLGKTVDVTIPRPPAKVFVAMDYHLDWVAASLAKWNAETPGGDAKRVFCNPGEGQEKLVHGNQEDIDLLVAFNSGGKYRLIFVEAKAYDSDGYAGYTNKQLKSKAARLKRIFGDNGEEYDCVTPHFLLMSHKPPTNQLKVSWPQWVLQGKEMPAHLQISLPPETTRRKVGRSDGGECFSVKFLKGK